MATIATPRTFTLTTPHLMEGDDVKHFQAELCARFDAWSINKHVSTDGAYGSQTRAATREVCVGLGIDPEAAMRDGVAPELRGKIHDPDRRTDAEVGRSMADPAKHFRADLRKQFADVGRVIIAPGANKQGQPISKMVIDYVARMSHRLGKPITITCGTNHNKIAVGGNVSDHFSGHAADLGMNANGGTIDGPVGDRIMAAALMEAGMSSDDALRTARGGGLFNFERSGQRIQCIWKTDIGGNHHDHVHVGVRPL